MSEMTVKTDDYPVIITREGNIHVLRIRELFLVERDRELSAGMERLEQRASALIDEQKALGDLGFLPPPGGVAKESRENRKLKIFAFK
ncbi:MAG: hypothetical protein ISR45_10525, partial [Rhodospirillales bacterium]|nr:hypothetical protein [Rhodospirillales bacterium]